ncbi:MAG: class I SAM-dependent methyltransferase [Proteobacteria bacterium]|nr:class I SAM-dependent methyltransferase [Pseudomonadota bacterium]MBU2620555.1 class I SAM-dependent methyltransferase [Pseudomonadota bacterium]
MKKDKILEFWNSRASLSSLAGTNDIGLKQLEIKTLSHYVSDGQRILDLGCGSGTTAFFLAENKSVEITGMDYSPEMVKEAIQERDRRGILPSKLNFAIQDIRNIDKLLSKQTVPFDIVITERVLINLETWEEQKNAIREIIKLLRPGGLYLMCENLRDGLDNLNEMRISVGLQAIASPWHNRYLEQSDILEIDFAELIEYRDFTSVYYLFSRIINAWLAKEQNEEPKYDAPINRLALELSKFPQFEALNLGQTRLWVFRRPE